MVRAGVARLQGDRGLLALHTHTKRAAGSFEQTQSAVLLVRCLREVPLVAPHLQPLRRRVQDALIRLVQQQPVDGINAEVRVLQSRLHYLHMSTEPFETGASLLSCVDI